MVSRNCGSLKSKSNEKNAGPVKRNPVRHGQCNVGNHLRCVKNEAKGKQLIECQTCCLKIANSDDFLSHKLTKNHCVNFLKFWLKQNENDLIRNKFGISISCLEIPECIPKLEIKLEPNKLYEFTLRIKNNNEGLRKLVTLKCCELLHKLKFVSIFDVGEVSKGHNVTLSPGTHYDIQVKVKIPHIGQYSVPLAFLFGMDGIKELFHIIRWFIFNCSSDFVTNLQAVVPYKQPLLRNRRLPAKLYYKGKALKKDPEIFMLEYEIPLQPLMLTREVSELVRFKFQKFDHMTKRQMELLDAIRSYSNNLKPHLYKDYFEMILWIEDHEMETEIRNFDMKNVVLKKINLPDLYELEVPGLSDNKPSVLRGDRIYLRIRNTYKEDCEFEGVVHDISSTKLLLGFNKLFSDRFAPGLKVDIRFACNKVSVQTMYRAVNSIQHGSHWPLLFPRKPSSTTFNPLVYESNKITFFDQSISNNLEQSTAVQSIVSGLSRPAPYLIFGPPGTGKTITLIEAIKQVWKIFPSARTLVCTPSNSAADLICQKLLDDIPSDKIFRMYTYNYIHDKVPDKIKVCSNYNKSMKSFYYPSRNTIKLFCPIVITTLVTSGRLVSANFPRNHFTHLFIDEAGQSLEPETIIPISRLLICYSEFTSRTGLGGQLVLAGDPYQLGPVLKSHLAATLKLDNSMLERLMTLEMYGSGNSNPNLFVKLLHNYRNHPSILYLPNKFFYKGELKASGKEEYINACCEWELLPQKGFPLLFHGVIGKDMREERCPSYFNAEEIATVIDYVKQIVLSESPFVNVRLDEVGIIAPYRQQVQKIEKELFKQNLRGILVGSVEEFQGREKTVIIISTVRSSPELLDVDCKLKLGFLKNPKRFNVALTRAKALLIIVGNPHLLMKDKYWNSLLEYCCKNSSYIGTPFDPEEESASDIIERFSHINIAMKGEEKE